MTSPAPEFSRIVRADKVTDQGMEFDLKPTPEERQALGERLGLLALDSLTAHVRLRRVRGRTIRVDGEIKADVVQACVVTLEPVPQSVEETFEIALSPDVSPDAEFDPNLTEEEAPEPLEGDQIDIGELVAQHLSLGLDPYPRKEGVEFSGYGDEPEAPVEPKSPFAKLASLKKDR